MAPVCARGLPGAYSGEVEQPFRPRVFEDTHFYTYRCCEDGSNLLVAWFQQDTAGIITISELKMEGANKELDNNQPMTQVFTKLQVGGE